MYNLEVQGNHNFFVGRSSWLVHNAIVCDGIDLEHIFMGEVVGGKAKGFHYSGGDWYLGNARIEKVIRSDPRGTGAFVAEIRVLSSTGTWKKKLSSMFPPSWSQQRVVDEIWEAFSSGSLVPPATTGGNWSFIGVSSSGMKITGFIENGIIKTAYPLIPKLP